MASLDETIENDEIEQPLLHYPINYMLIKITKAWLLRICHGLDMKVHHLLKEEMHGQAVLFIEKMLVLPPTMEHVRELMPIAFTHEVTTEYAIKWNKFDKILDDDNMDTETKEFIHRGLESYLYNLIYEASVELKKDNMKLIQPKHVNRIRLKYFPPEETDEE